MCARTTIKSAFKTRVCKYDVENVCLTYTENDNVVLSDGNRFDM